MENPSHGFVNITSQNSFVLPLLEQWLLFEVVFNDVTIAMHNYAHENNTYLCLSWGKSWVSSVSRRRIPQSVHLKISIREKEELAQWVAGLPSEHEDLSLNPQYHSTNNKTKQSKARYSGPTCNCSVGRGRQAAN